MNYLAALLGIALLGAITTAAIFRGNAEDYKAQLATLKASYATAAAQAKLDAAAQEKKDLDALNSQTSQALQSALVQRNQAQSQLVEYQKKIKTASGMKDLPHLCAGVPVASDLIPAPNPL